MNEKHQEEDSLKKWCEDIIYDDLKMLNGDMKEFLKSYVIPSGIGLIVGVGITVLIEHSNTMRRIERLENEVFNEDTHKE